MGSEQYCLRWNNHQSNLLGVFSQLLKDESLVDVTLVCSEGTSIRAHKVVLSACSSYFQTLFLDHPDRHPIVILKDVRFVELRTLIEFMYKGEVNVQYCQLSELLKTADSLKVKGLVEMTNQNTALREHEPPTEPERLRASHLLQKGDQLDDEATSASHNNNNNNSTSSSSAAIAPPPASVALKNSLNANPGLSVTSNHSHTQNSSSSSPSINHHHQHKSSKRPASRGQEIEGARETSSAPFPLYQPYNNPLFSGQSNNSGGGSGGERCHTTSPVGMHHQQRLMSPTSPYYTGSSNRLMKSTRDMHNMLHTKRPLSADGAGAGGASEAKRSPRLLMDRTRQHPHSLSSNLEREERHQRREAEAMEAEQEDEQEASDMRMATPDAGEDGEEGRLRDSKRNIKLLHNSREEDRPNSAQHQQNLENDISSRLTPQPSGSGGAAGTSSSIAKSELIGRSITSILGGSSAEISGGGAAAAAAARPSTSALPPMQQVPLSLKKEIDWDRADDKDSSSSDFRHPSMADLDATVAAEATSVVGGAGGSSGGGLVAGSGGAGARLVEGRGSSPANSLSPSPSRSASGSPGGGTGSGNNNLMYPCMYCTASFPNQNKLTRHILSHSLETLKFREIMHSSHIANLLPPPPMPPRSQHFNAALMAAAAAAVTSSRHQQQQHHHMHHQHSPASSLMCPPGLDSPIEGKGLAELAAAGHVSPLDMDFATAAALGPNLLGSGSLSSLHRSSSPGGGRASSPGMQMSRVHDGRGSGEGGGGMGDLNAGGSSSSSSISGGSGSNSVVMCKFCGKSFPDVSTLITHLPVHTGDRPFKCEYCGKAFKLRHHMKDHCRVHTGERPFRCTLCGKTFSRSTILKAHEKTHYPKFVRKFLSPSPVDTRDDSPQPSNSDATYSPFTQPGFGRIPSAGPSTTPPGSAFPFPFAPLGFGIFDSDPSRILQLLHHQSVLEEALRYRTTFSSPKESVRPKSLVPEFYSSKDHLLQSKRPNFIKLSNNNLRFPFNPSAELLAAHLNNNNNNTSSTSVTITPAGSAASPCTSSSSSSGSSVRGSNYHSVTITRSNPRSLNLDSRVIDLTDRRMADDDETSSRDDRMSVLSYTGVEELKNPKEVLDEILLKRSTSPATPLSFTQDQPHSSVRSPALSIASSSHKDPFLLQDGSLIEEETKCDVCGAVFPSVWLLEQHASLQHASDDCEKPFICEQCGQSYRYRSAYLKHREQNHRARLPADKLFTCDVCGMQFRYLKSFKKHRLNHALERLHGKNEKRFTGDSELLEGNNDEPVTSSNDLDSPSGEEEHGRRTIRDADDAVVLEEDVQDETIDSGGGGSSSFCDVQEANSTEPEVKHQLEINSFLQMIGQHHQQQQQQQQQSSVPPLPTPSINSLLTAEQIPSDQALGLNPQEASILNFLRIDAAERQRDRRFACPFCGKCVRSKENLKLHVRKHTGERPFVCLFCGRAFGGKSDLTRHLRIHTGERPYHCEACGKCFARADYLSKHLTTHIHNGPR